MLHLFPNKLKYAAAGNNIQDATVFKISEEGVTIDKADNIIGNNVADSQKPNKRFNVGSEFELNCSLVTSNKEVLDDMLHSNIMTEGDFQIPERKIQFHSLRPEIDDDEVTRLERAIMYGDFSLEHEGEDGYYLPVSFKSGSNSLLIRGFYRNSAFTAELGETYLIDTIDSAVTSSLPASPSLDDTVFYKDYNDNFDINALTIDGNGNDINSAGTTSFTADTRDGLYECKFDGSLWQVSEIT